jgi:hypothetical protein
VAEIASASGDDRPHPNRPIHAGTITVSAT